MSHPPHLSVVQGFDPAKRRNALLTALSPDDRALVDPLLEPVSLNQRDVLFEPNEPIQYLHFFESGLSSEIAISPRGEQIEVGCIGWEGLSGLPAVLGAGSSPQRSFMQIGGSALRLPTPALPDLMTACPTLSALLLRYAHVFMVQVATSALADGRYSIEQRLARWLLMCQDRIGDTLSLTHEFLALMLGVRRSGVTESLHILEGERIIKAERGLITILDRPKLEARAADSYGVPEAEYERLIGPFRKRLR